MYSKILIYYININNLKIMNLEQIKKKALELKEKASEQTQKAIDYSAKKLTNSNYTIDKKEELDLIIKKSATTTFKNKETWVEKQNKHQSVIIFADEWSEFFKEALYMLPVIITKAYTQNISVKLAKSKIEWVKLSDYKVKAKTLPCLVIFEDEKVLTTIEWSQNILKLVKSLDFDINKIIEGINKKHIKDVEINESKEKIDI